MIQPPPRENRDTGVYAIRVGGHLDARWASWFDGFSLTNQPDGTALLEGTVADQAVLHGLLQRVRDVGIPLISVQRIDPLPSAGSGR